MMTLKSTNELVCGVFWSSPPLLGDPEGKRMRHLKVRSLVIPPGVPDFFTRVRLLEEGMFTLLFFFLKKNTFYVRSVRIILARSH